MSEFLEKAAAELTAKITHSDFGGIAKFDVTGEGAIMMDAAGIRIGDEQADVTLSAEADTFRAIFDGDMNPTNAFMSGKLTVDGDMGMAMKLASVLA